ncbi:hypothetical protein AUC70_06200 [Methyloceanibacter stevinii]|uniref:Uncharacterized protein n=1 Tax=Methyloceanibacter stevinii TaxID=1774970 RepID=A0A1E3VQP1_9HYPH|nr:hypothetical protein AUC70_06200 [Methyloceanibacter stevinii]
MQDSLFEREDGLLVDLVGLGHLQFGSQDRRNALRFLGHTVVPQGRQDRQMVADRRELETDGTRIIGIEHHHIAHRRQRHASHVARPVGDL